jgi:hypothetical protein
MQLLQMLQQLSAPAPVCFTILKGALASSPPLKACSLARTCSAAQRQATLST